MTKKPLSPKEQQRIENMMYVADSFGDEKMIRLCIQLGANAQGVISKAIAMKNKELLVLALDNNADLKAEATPVMHQAYSKFDAGIFDELLRRGVSVDQKNEKGETVAMRALREGEVEKLLFLLSKDADMDKYVQPVFSLALEKNNFNLAQWALDNGAKPEIPLKMSPNGVPIGTDTSVLNILCDHIYFDAKLAELVLDRGGEVDARDSKGRTALRYVVEKQQKNCVRFLLDHGADPLLTDNEGVSPLDIAITRYGLREDRGEIALMLMEKINETRYAGNAVPAQPEAKKDSDAAFRPRSITL
jgi:hypothetical protein